MPFSISAPEILSVNRLEANRLFSVIRGAVVREPLSSFIPMTRKEVVLFSAFSCGDGSETISPMFNRINSYCFIWNIVLWGCKAEKPP
ncbi:MAG: hypothetical protein C4526_02345 [Nitrospiraceae bacterium]|nr:MAG: hypothetical protein C4526_02345 [Nitrospiraceae bacterium]